MLVQVVQAFYDQSADKVLRERGQLLEFEDEARAKELMAKKLVVQREIIEVKAYGKRKANPTNKANSKAGD